MSSPSSLKLDYTSASPIFTETPEFPESLEGISDTLKTAIRLNGSMSGSSSRLEGSRVSQPGMEESIRKTRAFLERTLSFEFSPNFEEMEPIGNDSEAYQGLGGSYAKNIADKIDAEGAPKPFAKISVGDDGDMIVGLSDSDPYISLDESRPDAKPIGASLVLGGINGPDHEDVLVGSSDSDSDHDSYGTEDLYYSIVLSEPRTSSLSLEHVCELFMAFNPERGSEIEFITDLFSKTYKQHVLFAAALTNTYSLIPKILALGRLVIDEMDENGNNALHLAIATRSVGAVATLLDAGANLFVGNKMGITGYEMMKLEKLFPALQQFRNQPPHR